jgi:hypothetical protein
MLCVIKPKGCKRCGGDLSLECDIYGVYAECIQCGANWNETEIRENAPGKTEASKADSPVITPPTTRRRR